MRQVERSVPAVRASTMRVCGARAPRGRPWTTARGRARQPTLAHLPRRRPRGPARRLTDGRGGAPPSPSPDDRSGTALAGRLRPGPRPARPRRGTRSTQDRKETRIGPTTSAVVALRGDEADLRHRHHPQLLRIVARDVRASPQLIEDACAFAWLEFVGG